MVSYGEAYEGFIGYPEFQWNLKRLDDIAALSNVLPTDVTIAVRYARVRSDLRAKGQLIPDNDLWIAATALAHDLTLVTRDRHFERIPGLELYR